MARVSPFPLLLHATIAARPSPSPLYTSSTSPLSCLHESLGDSIPMSSTSASAKRGGLRGSYASASVQARRGWRKASSGSRQGLVSDSHYTSHAAAHPVATTTTTRTIELPASPESGPSAQPTAEAEDDLYADAGGRVDPSATQDPGPSRSLRLLASRPTSTGQTRPNELRTPRQIAKSRATDSGVPLQSTPVPRVERPSASIVRSRQSLGSRDANASFSRDRSFHLPDLQARCQALTTNAQAVLVFYADLLEREQGHDDPIAIDAQLISEMRRSWEPFESYKVNQLLPRAQFHHHFILVDEHASLLLPPGAKTIPSGLEEAMRLANLATFVHYVWNLPRDSVSDVSEDWPLRSLPELQDAWRVFWRIIVPQSQPITDDILSSYLELSTQVFCARLTLLGDKVRNGDVTAKTAEGEARANLDQLLGSGAIQDATASRQMDPKIAQDVLRSWSQMSRIRRADVHQMRFDAEACRDIFKHSESAANITALVVSLAQDLEASLSESQSPHLLQDLFPSPPGSLLSRRLEAAVPSRRGNVATAQARHGEGSVVSLGESASSQNPGWLKELVAGKKRRAPAAAASEHSAGTEQSQMSMSNSQVMRLLTVEEREAALAEMFSQSYSRASVDEDDDDDESQMTETDARGAGELSAYFIPSEGEADEVEVEEEDDLSLDFSIQDGQIVHKSPKVSGKRAASHESDDEMEDGLEVVVPSPAKHLQIRSGRLQRVPAAEQANLFQPTGKGVRLTRFDSQSLSEVSLERTPARAVRAQNFYGRRARAVNARKPAPEPSSKTMGAAEEQQRTTKSTAASHRNIPGRAGLSSFVEVLVDQPSEDVRKAFRTHLTRAALPSRSPPRRLTRAAARRQEGATAMAMAEVQHSMDRMSVSHPAEQIDAVMNDNMPAIPAGNQAQGRELEASQAVEADANHFENLGAFEGDNDRDVREARKQLTLEYWFARVRPGFEQFPQPLRRSSSPLPTSQQRSSHRDAVLIPGSQASAAPDRPEDIVEAVIDENGSVAGESSEDIDEPSRSQISEVRRSQRTRQTGRRTASVQRGRVVVPSPESSEDELDDIFTQEDPAEPESDTPVPPASPIPKKPGAPRGVGQRLKKPWTPEEVQCLLDAMYKLARNKEQRPNYKIYAEILSRHGKHGSDDHVLQARSNDELKAKARAELLRMARECESIPYWKKLYWDNIFDTKEGKAALRAGARGKPRRAPLSDIQAQSQPQPPRLRDQFPEDEDLQDAVMRDVFDLQAGGETDMSEQDHEDLEEEEGGAYQLDSPQTSVDELEMEPDLRTQTPRPQTPPPPSRTNESQSQPHHRFTPPPPSVLKSPHRRRGSRAESHVHFEDSEEEEERQAPRSEPGVASTPTSLAALRERLTAGPSQAIKRGRDLVQRYSRRSQPPEPRLPMATLGSDEEGQEEAEEAEVSPRKRPRARPQMGRQSAPPAPVGGGAPPLAMPLPLPTIAAAAEDSSAELPASPSDEEAEVERATSEPPELPSTQPQQRRQSARVAPLRSGQARKGKGRQTNGAL